MTKQTLNRIHDSIKIHEQTREFPIPKGKPPSCPLCHATKPSEYKPRYVFDSRQLTADGYVVCLGSFHNFNPNAQSSSHS